jgi:hypothetical protein
MPTTYKYPFTTGEDLKAAASQVNLNFDIANIQSSLSLAANDLKDVVGDEVYAAMLTFYNEGTFNPTGATLGDKLVNAFRPALANLALYHHFIWLQLQISNSGINVAKGENVTSAYKYQTDEAKDKLLQTAWIETNNLINVLNAEATPWKAWAPATAYVLDEYVKNAGTYYQVTTAFTSPATFTTDNLTEVDESVTEVIHLKEWTNADQYSMQGELIFVDYKEFNQYFSIDKNAAYYYRMRYILVEIIKEHIKPRIASPLTITDELKLIKVKRFLAYKAVAESLLRLDPMHLPVSLRQSIRNDMTTKENDFTFLKEKLRAAIDQKATNYLHELDIYTAAQVADADIEDGETQYTPYESNTDTERKFFSAL